MDNSKTPALLPLPIKKIVWTILKDRDKQKEILYNDIDNINIVPSMR